MGLGSEVKRPRHGRDSRLLPGNRVQSAHRHSRDEGVFMKPSRAPASALALMLLAGSACLGAPVPRFETDIIPLFQAKCLRCHGDKGHKAELDLRTPASVLDR